MGILPLPEEKRQRKNAAQGMGAIFVFSLGGAVLS